ncbi:phosphonate ABC transporter ATP-binding protein [Vulcanibacillus modesticaldus]|uniref:Phosphonate ABC transporter ATP-binding protein n=1 Tax=Vulcanibacillus modesticaldus TaxID=337097 RepID=A0A1D2YV33_9BACI|nr:phosphonate ABC transporter ATP-binding protein [Vulcanibacillus modesticaldus]OEF99568.1 phosphonate ABC transporter ATP-binding protein [Vulcanibacillus modesticaldus]
MLKIINVTKKYPKSEAAAIKNVNLQIKTGEFIGILGRSGAGKSTLIRCINQLVRPTSGEVIWNGKNITEVEGRELLKVRCDIGMIFQNYNLINRVDVLTNVLVGKSSKIAFWRHVIGVFPKDKINQALEALERVGIKHLAYRRVDELSGGQQQRVAIARVLMQNPKLILGDEPVASLDPITTIMIMDFLKELHEKEKITMIINLHNVELAKKYATRIIGINDGQIVFDGLPEQLTDDIIKKIYLSEKDFV